MKKIKMTIPLVMIGSFFLILLVFISLNTQSLFFDNSNYHKLNDNWFTETFDLDTLPATIDVPKNEEITIFRTLPADFHTEQYLLIRTSLQNITVRLDGDILYQNTHEPIGDMNTFASVWHIILIPYDSDGLEISITTVSPYSSMSGRFNQLIYGTLGEINYYLLTTYRLRLIIGCLVVLIGILLVFINLIAFKKFSLPVSLLGISAFFLGTWIIAESRILQMFVGDTLFIGSLAYLSLAFLPLPVSLYLEQFVLPKYKKIFTIYIGILIGNIFFTIIAHVTGFMDFFESLTITQILMGIGVIFLPILVGVDTIKKLKKSTDAVIILISIIIVGLVEFINFNLGNFDYTSIFATIAIGILMVIFLIRYVKYIFVKVKQGYEKEIYHKLAYRDPLTKLYNRLAFNDELEAAFKDSKTLSNLMLIYFDLDDLKRINDSKGHLEGDQALIDVSKRLLYVYKPYGNIYRIGGDEFVFIGTKLKGKDYVDINKAFEDYMKEQNQVSRYQLHISYGVTFYNPVTDQNPKDLLIRADLEMYKNKTEYKEHHKK